MLSILIMSQTLDMLTFLRLAQLIFYYDSFLTVVKNGGQSEPFNEAKPVPAEYTVLMYHYYVRFVLFRPILIMGTFRFRSVYVLHVFKCFLVFLIVFL